MVTYIKPLNKSPVCFKIPNRVWLRAQELRVRGLISDGRVYLSPQ